MSGLWSAFRASRAAQIALAILVLIVAGLALYLWAITQHSQTVETAVQQGREAQRRDDATEVLNRTLEAINAEEAVRHNPAVRNAACLRHSRTPENC